MFFGRCEEQELSQLEAAELLGVSAFLVDEEGTLLSFRELGEVFTRHGLPRSFYTDRGSHYFHTPKAGGKVDKAKLTQLSIEHIAAYSPEARGRSERAFRTLQDRLCKELALAGVASVDDANRFLAETFIADYNERFAVAPEEPGSAFVAVEVAQWQDVLCVQEECTVAADNTVRFQGLSLQSPPSPFRPHYVKAKLRAHHYPDRTHAIFQGPRLIARHHANGRLVEDDTIKRTA